jgi:hypothetical protein
VPTFSATVVFAMKYTLEAERQLFRFDSRILMCLLQNDCRYNFLKSVDIIKMISRKQCRDEVEFKLNHWQTVSGVTLTLNPDAVRVSKREISKILSRIA